MKLRKGRVFGVLLVITIVIGAAIYITNKNQSSKKAVVNNEEEIKYSESIRLGVSNYDTFNPILTKNSVILNINKLVYEPLFEIDSHYKLKPCLAKEYAKTSITTYIIKIDNSAKWSDGSNFTAEDVKYTINTIKSSDNIYSENVKNIQNVDVIDNETIKITLTEETPFFEYNLIFPIMSEKYYRNENFYTSSKNPIGTGRYKIDSITNNQIVLSKVSEYRKKEIINKNINKIYINIFSEIGEVYNSFKLGNIDVLNTSRTQYKNYIGTLGYYVKEYNGREYDFLSCNCDDYILKETNVRKALNYAIDKDNIVSNVYNNEYYKSNYFLDYGNSLYVAEPIEYNYNTEKAKEILNNNGWRYSNNCWRKNGVILNITISVNSSNKKRVQVANVIKSQLENIGIIVNVKELNDAEYAYCLANKNYQILLTGIYNGYSADLNYFYGENNIANYTNDEVNKIINEINNITDDKVLKEKYKNIIELTLGDSPYIGLYRNKCSMIVSKKMSGNFEPDNYNVFDNFETWNREE